MIVHAFGLIDAHAIFMRLMDDILWPFTNSLMVFFLRHPHLQKELGIAHATYSTGP